MKIINGKKVYECRKPAAARLEFVESIGDQKIVSMNQAIFGVAEEIEIDTVDGPAMMLIGSEDHEDWNDPKYQSFVFWKGIARAPRHSAGPTSYEWKDRYWVRAVMCKSAIPFQGRKSGKVVKLIFYEVKLQP